MNPLPCGILRKLCDKNWYFATKIYIFDTKIDIFDTKIDIFDQNLHYWNKNNDCPSCKNVFKNMFPIDTKSATWMLSYTPTSLFLKIKICHLECQHKLFFQLKLIWQFRPYILEALFNVTPKAYFKELRRQTQHKHENWTHGWRQQ